MNSKMTTNSQLSMTEPKKKNTRTSTESEKWRSHGVGRGKVRMGGKAQGIRRIIGRHKIDGEMLRMV